MKAKDSVSAPPVRRYDLDWLRTLAVLLVLPFHSLLIFVMNPDSVVYMKDKVDCFYCDWAAGFIAEWQMQLLFIIAGMSVAFALSRRSAGQYLKERVTRLLVPLLFGIAVLIPPMTYITQIAQGKTLTFWQHYASFWTFGPDLSGRSGTFTPAHLWFIMFLFLFSILALPLFLLLRWKGSQGVVRGMAWFFEKPMALLVLGLLVAAAGRTDILGANNPVYYIVVFICGYLLMTDERYQKAIDRDWPFMLLLGIILETMRKTGWPATVDNTLPRAIRDVVMEFNSWAWTLAILGMGHRWLNQGSKVLNYLAEASYPIYIIHFLVLTTVTFFLVRVPAAIPVKYVLIVSISYVFIFLLYEIARRIRPLRFLLGMKEYKARPQEVRKEVPAQA